MDKKVMVEFRLINRDGERESDFVNLTVGEIVFLQSATFINFKGKRRTVGVMFTTNWGEEGMERAYIELYEGE